jgi:hypothetical protein
MSKGEMKEHDELAGLSPYEKLMVLEARKQTLALQATSGAATATQALAETAANVPQAILEQKNRIAILSAEADAAERGNPVTRRIVLMLPCDIDGDGAGEPVEASADVLFRRLQAVEITTDKRYLKSTVGDLVAFNVMWPTFKCEAGEARIDAHLEAMIAPIVGDMLRAGQVDAVARLREKKGEISMGNGTFGAPVHRRNFLWNPYQRRLIGKTIGQIVAGGARLVEVPAAAE